MKDTNKLEGVGIGLRHKHLEEIIFSEPDIAWLEIHTENFLYPDSPANLLLDKISKNYPISAHCVGMSLGSTQLDTDHIKRIKKFIDIYDPALVSDHLSWSRAGNAQIPDLLPLPYTEEALNVLVKNIETAQDILRRTILLENPSTYLSFSHSTIDEANFLAEAATRSGCGILLDINNIYVTCQNHGLNAHSYMEKIPTKKVKELHLAGFDSREISGKKVLIDDHGAPVCNEVWDLYEVAIKKFGPIPTLVEWDTDVPALSTLLSERDNAAEVMNRFIEN